MTSKLFPPSLTFTKAPTSYVMLDTSLESRSPQHAIQMIANRSKQQLKARSVDRSSSEVPDKTECDTGGLKRSVSGQTEGKVITGIPHLSLED